MSMHSAANEGPCGEPPTYSLRVISGGQTGVDRAALDAAMMLNIPHGGWCPRERLAEDGRIPDRYRLQETNSSEYAVRTEWNVRDSDVTLILTQGEMSGGTKLTAVLALRYSKPLLVINLTENPLPMSVVQWLLRHNVHILNVAGPRESTCPGIHKAAESFLCEVLRAWRSSYSEQPNQ